MMMLQHIEWIITVLTQYHLQNVHLFTCSIVNTKSSSVNPMVCIYTCRCGHDDLLQVKLVIMRKKVNFSDFEQGLVVSTRWPSILQTKSTGIFLTKPPLVLTVNGSEKRKNPVCRMWWSGKCAAKMFVLPTNLQQLCDATIVTWTKISGECFQHLV